jgi:shikimate kinase/3-dehydroquinate synthase
MRRPLILNGFMATGKSTVGALVAQRAHRPFIDLDRVIEDRSGSSVESLFEKCGESAFRALERQSLLAVLAEAERALAAPVIAVGGGALLARDLRLKALDECVLVSLEGPAAVLARRALAQGSRPLLTGSDPTERVSELLELRARAYAEAHARVSCDAPVEEVATEVAAVWERDELAVAAGHYSYGVQIGQGIATSRVIAQLKRSPVCVFVSDTTVTALHGARMAEALVGSGARLVRVELEAGEAHKNIASIECIWRAALAGSADRQSTFIGFGGGVVTDMTGFAAATWMRGVRWVCVPTTLLAMVDASVGGKTGVDLESAKNAVGAFWQPSAVVCDIDLLRTEARRGFVSGLAEVVKTALIGDPQLFSLLEHEAERVALREPELCAELVRRSIRVKARIVSFDERESSVRATLNLGHTVGHALEAQAGYTALTHGEAVSLGLVAALRLGEVLGQTPPALRERTTRLLERLGLPVRLDRASLEAAASLIGHDKKRSGANLGFVVARELGRVETLPMPVHELRAAVVALEQ